jgi:hypothetical protein
MKTITLKKISFDDLLILQNVVIQFRTQKADLLHTTTYNDAYFNNLLSADIAYNLSFRLRSKIENEHKAFTNFKVKISEAIVLLQCCNDYKTAHKEVNSVNRKFLNELHKQLINL